MVYYYKIQSSDKCPDATGFTVRIFPEWLSVYGEIRIYEFKRDRPPPRALAVADSFDDYRRDDYTDCDYSDF